MAIPSVKALSDPCDNWEGLNDKRRYPEIYMRLTQMEKAKVEYLSRYVGKSMHEYCLGLLVTAINNDVNSLLRLIREQNIPATNKSASRFPKKPIVETEEET